jgi:hypothetical protein
MRRRSLSPTAGAGAHARHAVDLGEAHAAANWHLPVAGLTAQLQDHLMDL